jgi:hypothetical protein
LLIKWNTYLPENQGWILIYQNLLTHALYTASEKTLKHPIDHSNSVFQGVWVSSVLYRLLVLRPLEHGNKREDKIEEACRLASLIYLAPIRRQLKEWFPVRSELLVRKLREVLLPVNDWVELWPLRLWCLYMAAIETKDPESLEWFIRQLADDAWEIGMRDWNGIKQCIMQILWTENVFGGLDKHLVELDLNKCRT